MAVSDQIKEAIRRSGLSLSQIAEDTGIPQPNLSRFLSEDADQHQDIRLEKTADRLCGYLGLVLVKERRRVS